MATREIGATLKLDGEKEFNSQMTAVNSNLKTLGTEMKAVTAEYADNAGSTAALQAKQEVLTKQIDQQKEKVRALTQASQEAAEAYGEDSKQADKYAQQLNAARKALADMENAQEKTAEAIKKNESLSTKLHSAWEKLQSAGAKVGKAADVAAKPVQLAAKGMEAAAKGAAKLATGVGVAAGALAAVSAAGVSTLTQWAKEAADAGTKGFQGYAKSLEGLSKATSGAKAALAGTLLPALQSLSVVGAEFLNDFTKEFNAAAGDPAKLREVLSSYITKGVELLRTQLPELLSIGKDLLGAFGGSIGDNSDEILNAGMEIVETLLDGVEENLPAVTDGALRLVMQLLTALLGESPELLEAGLTMVTTLVEGIATAISDGSLVQQGIAAVTALLGALVGHAPDLILAGLELILALVEGLIEAIPDLVAAIPELVSEFVEGFSANADKIKDVGKQIIDKVLEGLKNAWHTVAEWFSDMTAGLKGTAKITVKKDSEGGHSESLDNHWPGTPGPRGPGSQYFDVPTPSAGSSQSVTNVNIYTQRLSQSEQDYLLDQLDRRLRP